MKTVRTSSFIAACVGAALLMGGCAATSAPTASSTSTSAAKVAVLSEAAEGDPWADLVASGARAGAGGGELKRIAGVQTTAIEQQIRSVAAGHYSPVVVLQDNMATAVAKLAPSFPNTRFVVVDSFVADNAPNVTSVTINATDTSYLAGAVAGLTSTTTKVGFLGGADVPIIEQFLCGFKGGVTKVAPTDTVVPVYAGTFTDPTTGQNLATQMYNDGVGVIFQAAALTGLGVLKAAAATGKQAIGVDTWQGDQAPGHVVWSALKDGGGATAFAVKEALAGTLTGGSLVWDSTHGAKLYDDRDMKSLSSEQQATVKEIADGLQHGTITPAC